MALTERLAILLDVNGAAAVKEFEKVGNAAERELGKAENKADRLGSQLTSVGTKMIGVGAVLIAGFAHSAEAAEEANQSHLKLDNTLANAPQLAGASKDAFLEQASALQKVTKADDEAVISTQALLGQFGLSQSAILETTPLVLDLAQKMGIDLDTAAKMVGKSVEGSAGALKKAGIEVDETAFKTDHYGATIAALRKTVGGFAEQEGKTFSGQLTIMKNQLHDIEEGVGVGAAQAFSKLLGPVQSASQHFTELDAGTQATVGSVGTYASVALIATGATSTLIGWVIKARENFTAAASAVKGWGSGLSASTAVSAAAVVGIVAVTAAIHHMNSASEESNNKLFKGLDFSDLEGANQKLNQTGEQLNQMGAKWDSYSAAEKLAHAEEYKIWNDGTAQQEEHRKHLEASTAAVVSIGQQMGISSQEAERLVKELHFDPANVPFDKLVPTLERYKNGTLDAADAQRLLAGETETEAEQLDKANKVRQEAISKLKEFYDVAAGHVDTERSLAQAHDDLSRAIQSNGVYFDIGTQQGRDNQKAFEDAGQAAVEWGIDLMKSGTPAEEAAAKVGLHVLALRNQMLQAGFTQSAVDQYIQKLHLTPNEIATQFKTSGVVEATNQIRELNGELAIGLQRMAALGFAGIGTAIGNAPKGKASGTNLLGLPKKALGGAASGAFIAGDDGPEVINVGSFAANVTPNHELGRDSGGGTTTAVAAPVIVQVQLDGRTVAEVVVPHLAVLQRGSN